MATGGSPRHQPSPSRSGQQGSPNHRGDRSGQQRSPPRHNKVENIAMQQINPGFEEDEGPWDNNVNNSGNAGLRQRKPNLYRQASSNDANDLLSMMPSRHFDKGKSIKGASAHDDVHRSASRRKLQRQNTMFNTLRKKSSDDVLDSIIHDIGTDPKMAVSDLHRDDHIRSIPTNLTNRKTIKRKLSNFDRSELPNQAKPGTLKRMKYNMQLGFRTMRLGIRDTLYRFDLWHSHLRLIEGHFGTGVVSYFTFLRTLLYLNIPVFLLSVSFIIIPQMLYRFYQQEPTGYSNNQNFTGRELLTGAGWFEATEMYYGTYINGTINVHSGYSNGSSQGLTGLSYDMSYAYLLTSGGFYLLCLIILARSLAKSYRKNFIEASGEVSVYYMGKVLCGWDFSINDPNAAQLRHKAIFNELKEFLSSSRQGKVKKTFRQNCCLLFLRIMTTLLVIALIGGSGYLIWYISITKSIQNDIDVLNEMAMPLCISAFNLILPIAFSIIATVEQWERPKIELYLTMLRTVCLKGVNLGVLIFFWYQNVNCTASEDNSEYSKSSRCIDCWETFMGEEIYRLVIVDFIVSLLVTFVAEFLRSVMAKRCCKLLGSPEFEIGRNTLNLIYSQALCWLGHFYCPVLSFIQIIKLVVIFYVKRLSVMMNCVPSQKPWRAARAHTIFLGYLFCAYFMMCSSLAVSIVLIKPSVSCGPFRGLDRPYDVIIVLLNHVKTEHSIIDSILMFISSHGFIAACIVALCIGVYYLSMLGQTRREMIAMLKHQIQLEGKDKVFLLRMYQEISKDIVGGLPPHKPLTSPDINSNPPPSPRRRFVKTVVKEAEEERIRTSSLLEDFKQGARETHLLTASTGDVRGAHPSPRPSLRSAPRSSPHGSDEDITKAVSPVSISRSADDIKQGYFKRKDYENVWDYKEKPDNLPMPSEQASGGTVINVGDAKQASGGTVINVGEAKLKNPLYEDENVGPPPRPMSALGHRISVEALPPMSESRELDLAPAVSPVPPGPAEYRSPSHERLDTTELDRVPEERGPTHLVSEDVEPAADYDDDFTCDNTAYSSSQSSPQNHIPEASYEPHEVSPASQQVHTKQSWDSGVEGENSLDVYNGHQDSERLDWSPGQDLYGPPANYVPPPPPPFDPPLPPTSGQQSYGPPENYEPPPPPPASSGGRISGDYGTIW